MFRKTLNCDSDFVADQEGSRTRPYRVARLISLPSGDWHGEGGPGPPNNGYLSENAELEYVSVS